MIIKKRIQVRRTPCYHYTKIKSNVIDFATGEELAFTIKYDYCGFFKAKINTRNCSVCPYYEKRKI
jgi:hypothetical protein